jgi:epoxide hydrolase-like predicted phosphatase
MIKAVIWDLGGVLVRTTDYTRRDAVADKFGMTREALEELVYGEDSGHKAQLGIIGVEQHWENVRSALGLAPEEVDGFRHDFWSGDQLDEELVTYIRALKSNYQTGLLSNAFSNLRQVIRDVWRMEDVFDQIVISAEEGLIKPDARIYQLILRQLKVHADEAIFVDDMPKNVEAAQRLSMHGVLFCNPQQAREAVSRILNGEGE